MIHHCMRWQNWHKWVVVYFHMASQTFHVRLLSSFSVMLCNAHLCGATCKCQTCRDDKMFLIILISKFWLPCQCSDDLLSVLCFCVKHSTVLVNVSFMPSKEMSFPTCDSFIFYLSGIVFCQSHKWIQDFGTGKALLESDFVVSLWHHYIFTTK